MAKYDLSNQFKQEQALRRLNQLIKKGAFIELKEITSKSLRQNNYFHLIASYFALEFGYTLSYVKEEIIKRNICKEIFVQKQYSKKTGEEFINIRSFADLDKEETATVTNKFYNYSLIEAGIRLPHPDDLLYEDEIKQIIQEIDYNKEYL